MKKFIIVLAAAFTMFTSCNLNMKTNVTNKDIPSEYKTLEFWNGGGLIGKYNDVTMRMEVVSSAQVVGNDISFYKYHVTSNKQNIDDWIIDSESLALKYTIEEK